MVNRTAAAAGNGVKRKLSLSTLVVRHQMIMLGCKGKGMKEGRTHPNSKQMCHRTRYRSFDYANQLRFLGKRNTEKLFLHSSLSVFAHRPPSHPYQ